MRSKKALYNIISNLLLQIVIVIYGFIVPKIIISSFGSSVNGLISSITQFLAYITLLESGFGPVVKAALYKPIAEKDKKTINNILRTAEKFFRVIAGIFLVYIVVLTILYPIIVSSEFGNIYTISLIVIISISTFAEYFFGMTYKLYLQADQKTYVISIIQILTYILSTICIIILAKLNASIQIIKLISGIIFVLRPLMQNYYVKKKYRIDLKNADDTYELKQKWDGLAQHIAAVIHGNTDITILTFFCSLNEVSVYSVYYLVVKGIKQIIQAFSSGIDASFGDMIAKNEHENLNKKFNIYEIFYFTICTICFTSAMILIVPFIEVYTKGITDTNYIRYAFGYLLVISEYIWAIRLPYSSVILSAGHFKETRIGAWIEAITNIVISIILVSKLGIIGVTIGTIIAMTIRTAEFIYHTNKYILKRNIFKSIKKIIWIMIETIIIIVLANMIPRINNVTYMSWFINAIIIFVEACIITLLFNVIIYKKYIKDLLNILKESISKKENRLKK
jgi:O-antigen/teichoic acid export membrane protein